MTAQFDVVVAGGGPAGIAAAISAATTGARTLLVERSDILGGNAGNALVHTICGLYLPDRERPEPAHGGFPATFATTLLRRGAAAPPERAGRVHVLPTYPHRLAAVARDVCADQDRLSVWLPATITAVAAGDAGFTLQVERGGRTAAVRAAIAVDTTGDATIAALCGAGVSTEASGRLQTPSLIFRVRGVAAEATAGFARLRVAHAVARAAALRELPESAGSILLRPGPTPGEAYVTLNVDRPIDRDYKPWDADEMARLADDARRDAVALIDYLRRHRSGFADCEVVEWPRRIGVRESRRIEGLATVSADQILAGARGDDEVTVSTWPIELWHDRRGARFRYPNGASSLPLAALISRDNPRLGTAGRCMSATHEALGALRVIGTAMATGEAIGRAAALAVARRCTLADVPAADARCPAPPP